MKRMRFLVMMLLTMVMTCSAAVALAGPTYENPFQDMYKNEAQTLHKNGNAKIVFMLLDTNRAPLKGAKLVYNTTKGRGLEGVTDEKGMLTFSMDKPELFYIRDVEVDGKIIPIGGSYTITDIGVQDIHRGQVKWIVIHRYNSATFMSYDAGGDTRPEL